jgi:hypothetical protein
MWFANSYEKYYCNHDAMIKNDISNYFERGNHATEFLNKSNDPPFVPKISKCIIQISPLLIFLLIIATTMKEEVISNLFMLLVMI